MHIKKWVYTFFVVLMAIQILFPAPLLADAIGQFKEVRGDVSLMRAKTTIKPKAGDAIETKDVVITGDKARAKLLLTDDSLLSVGPNSNLEMTEYLLDKNKRTGVVSLKVGLLHTNVEKFLEPGSKFEVHTPNAVAGARGTGWLTLVELASQASVAPIQTSVYALQQSIFFANAALPAQAVTVVAGNFSVAIGAALPTLPAAFSSVIVGPMLNSVGVTAVPGASGAAVGTTAQTTGTGTAAGTGATGAGTSAAGAAGAAGAGAGAGIGAGIGVGTVAIGATALGAGLAIAGATSGSSTTTTTTHTTTSHH